MAGDLAFIGFKGAFTFGVECNRYCRRVGAAFCDGVAEELEDVVVLQALKAAGAILDLTDGMPARYAEASHCQGPYQNIPHQARVDEKSLVVMIINLYNFRDFLV